jgi:hypothetical protein
VDSIEYEDQNSDSKKLIVLFQSNINSSLFDSHLVQIISFANFQNLLESFGLIIHLVLFHQRLINSGKTCSSLYTTCSEEFKLVQESKRLVIFSQTAIFHQSKH